MSAPNFDRLDIHHVLVGDPDDLYLEPTVSAAFGETTRTWQNRRDAGTGPAWIKLGRKVYYRRADIRAWVERNRRAA